MNLRTMWATEPTFVITGVGVIAEALLLALIAFGVPITPDQKLTITGLGTTIITVLCGLITRSQVTPTPSPMLPGPPHG